MGSRWVEWIKLALIQKGGSVSSLYKKAPKGALVMLTKFPFRGEVKTRLAADIGQAKAAALSWAFVQDTILKLKNIQVPIHINLAMNKPPGVIKTFQSIEIIDQGEGDLGARLSNISQGLLKKHPWVLLIGSDAPHIPTRIYEEAIEHMNRGHDALGPSTDGGYYIQGLHACPDDFFLNIPWSCKDTCQAMKSKYEDLSSRPLIILPEHFDIDYMKDLEKIKEDLLLIHTQKII